MEGSRIGKGPALDPEKDILRDEPKRMDCCGSLCAWNDLSNEPRFANKIRHRTRR
jgi:hypothetical protein